MHDLYPPTKSRGMQISDPEMRLKAIQAVTAETAAYQSFLEACTMIPTKDTYKDMRQVLIYWVTYLEALTPKMSKEVQPLFKGVQEELKQALAAGRHSGSSSPSPRSTTRKIKQEGGVGFGSAELTIRKANAIAPRGFIGRQVDKVKFEKGTLKRIEQLELMANRLILAGRHSQVAIIQAVVDGMREDVSLYPAIPLPLILATVAYLIYKSPTYLYAIAVSGLSFYAGLPLATGGAAAGAVWQGAKNFLFGGGGSEMTAREAALHAATVTGKTVTEMTDAIVGSATPEIARELGYLIGAVIFLPAIFMTLIRYNTMIGEARRSAREGRIKMLFGLEDELSKRLEGAKGVSNVPLLGNIGAADPETQARIQETIQQVYNHFEFSEKDKKKSLSNIARTLKGKYKTKVKQTHPDKGGSNAEFRKTQELYKKAQDILLAQGVRVNLDA